MLIDVKPKVRSKRASSNTVEIRSSFQALVDGNARHVGEWIRQTAVGIQQTNKEGEPQFDNNGCPIWLLRPDPSGAVKLVTDLAEFVIPKLSRTEAEVVARIESADSQMDQMPTAELQRRLLHSLGLGAEELEVVPVPAGEPVTIEQQPTPANGSDS